MWIKGAVSQDAMEMKSCEIDSAQCTYVYVYAQIIMRIIISKYCYHIGREFA